MIYILLVASTLVSNFYLSEGKVDLKDDDVSDTCESMLESFAYVTGNFTYCTIYYARPIRLCQLCNDKYLKVRVVYNDINDFSPTSGEICKDKLFNLDRLQVVDSGFQFVTHLWSRANCDSCYVLNDRKEPSELKPGVQLMLNISREFEHCVKNHTNDSLSNIYDPLICQDCQPYYHQINLQYSVLRGSSGEEDICMDIVDLVNRTRLDWSTSFGCYVDRKKPELVYLLITGFVSTIPFLFYFCTWGFISKKQQIIALQNNVPDYLKEIHRRASNSFSR